ncbi:MAG: hypothetical protein U5L06_07010 [Rhodovibrio sp.]|nr:hypothetical protein [Rhodovibrio sp.]
MNGLTLTVSNVTDGASELLTVDGEEIALTAGSTTTAANGYGVNVSVAGSTATVTLTLNGATPAAVQTLVDGLAYRNASDNPTDADRTVTLTELVDDGGTPNGGDDTAALAIAATVNVEPVNDEPSLTATGATPTFDEGDGAASLFSGASVDLVESAQGVDGLTLTVSNVTDGASELLTVDGEEIALTAGSTTTAANGLTLSVSVAGSTATVTLTLNGATPAAVQTLVDGLATATQATTLPTRPHARR